MVDGVDKLQVYQLNIQCLLNISNHLKRQVFLPLLFSATR